MTPQVTLCPPAPQTVFFDEHAFQNPRRRTSAEAGLDYAEYSTRCHTIYTRQVHSNRQPAPWAMCDETLRELLLTHLERRFYVHPAVGDDTDKRLDRIEAAAKRDASRGDAWLRNAIVKYRDPKRRRPGDAAIQLQSRDTCAAMAQRGAAELLAAIVYLYYRMGFRSGECAELFSLKSEHVRQLIFRLGRTYKRFLAPGATCSRMGTHTRIVAGVGEWYSVRRRLRKSRSEAQRARRAREAEKRLAGKTVGERHGQGQALRYRQKAKAPVGAGMFAGGWPTGN